MRWPTRSEARKPRNGRNGSLSPLISLPPGAARDPREVFLVLPGLNLPPEKMTSLREFLLAGGHAVANPPLFGISPPDPADWEALTAEEWLADLDRAEACIAAAHPEASLSLLGYSLGALLGMTWSLTRSRPFRRAILLSPAFGLKWYAPPALAALAALLPGRLRLPSAGPAPDRLHQGTTLAAYRALLELMRRFSAETAKLEQPGAALPPQFIAFAPRDELISLRSLRRYYSLATSRLTLYTLGHDRRPGIPFHLGIDEETLGAAEWNALREALGEWLNGLPDRATGAEPTLPAGRASPTAAGRPAQGRP